MKATRQKRKGWKNEKKKKREENGGKRNFKVAVKLGYEIKTGPER